ncbi:hypothetical protein [Psychrobacter immobilis]|uniref:hypothetical protein n=1 Tax=Psychrobacter immobilis TaxID=498 RepID=UPI0028E75276|nr:hypothetical protein [Psychrobacter immobilis]
MADSMKNMLYNQSDLASCSIMALNAWHNLYKWMDVTGGNSNYLTIKAVYQSDLDYLSIVLRRPFLK